jgi:hypothetical protein
MKTDSSALVRSIGNGFFGLLVILIFGYSQAALAQNPATEEKPTPFTPPNELPTAPPQLGLFELGVSYNYLNALDATDVKDLHGFDASAFVNLNPLLALGGDFIGGFGNNASHERGTNDLETVQEGRLVFVFGPRLSIRPKERLSIFFQALFGGVYDHTDTDFRGPAHFRASSSTSVGGWAFDLSVGTDWRLTSNLSWRVIEVGYLGTRFSSSSENDRENNFRLSTGVVWSFGGRQRAISAK